MSIFENNKVLSHLVKVRPGTYLSRNDPSFLRKYLRYFPNDGEKLYEYAQKLNNNGQEKKAHEYYLKSAENGYFRGIQEINSLKEKSNEKIFKKDNKKAKTLPIIFSSILLLFIICMVLYFLLNHDFFSKNSSYIQDENYRLSSTEINLFYYNIPLGTSNLLPVMVVQNAIERYKEERGSYPVSLDELTDKIPENWISSIPKDMIYTKEKSQYFLEQNELIFSSSHDLLELDFYPETNQLALMSNGKVLSLYPVASGKKSLPFTESKVLYRVANPNGKTGVLGVRGLVLDDNYAIHGTNDPESIGKKITDGCLRMYDSDIISLYPYISKGTPFKVAKGTPAKPLLTNGLPPLDNLTNLKNETLPNKKFYWHH